MTNTEIATVLETIADLLEFQGANPFRVRAYRNAARTIHDLAEPVTQILDSADRRLTDIPGIGATCRKKSRPWSAPARSPCWTNCWPKSPRACCQ